MHISDNIEIKKQLLLKVMSIQKEMLSKNEELKSLLLELQKIEETEIDG